MSLFSFLDFNRSRKLQEALRNGAVVIDVRTPLEFESGCISRSINIPLSQITANISRIKSMGTAIILCCASGGRSSVALLALRHAGLTRIYNGGRWQKVKKLMEQTGILMN
jgi:phage shock protein E